MTADGRWRVATVVMWDIDGTLLVADKGQIDLFLLVLRETGPAPATPPGLEKDGKTDRRIAQDYLAWAGRPASDIDAFMVHLDESSDEFMARYPRRLIPGVGAALQLARELGAINVLLTGNTRYRAQVKLANGGVDLSWFDWERSAFGGQETDRRKLSARIAEHFPGHSYVVVGDTDHDADAAQHVGAHFIRIPPPPTPQTTQVPQAPHSPLH